MLPSPRPPHLQREQRHSFGFLPWRFSCAQDVHQLVFHSYGEAFPQQQLLWLLLVVLHWILPLLLVLYDVAHLQ